MRKLIIAAILCVIMALCVWYHMPTQQQEFYMATYDKNTGEWVVLEFGPDCSWGSDEVASGSGITGLVEVMDKLER